ncbi:MAG: tRNA (adenosine(37)-N6)-threonylcarbamoyltransferase complex dimerization subunit type 1 TsaB [Pseudomonadota bacterium]
MITLGFDTSGNYCAAALHRAEDDEILAEISEDIGRGHAERLMDVIATTLDAAQLEYDSIARVAASAGPGSFTGVRVGLATARGLALGLSVPVVGVNTLAAHRRAANHENLLVVVDARRGEAYCQIFEGSGFVSATSGESMPKGAFLADYETVARMVRDFPRKSILVCGSGSGELNRILENLESPPFSVLNNLATPPISAIVREGAAMDYGGTSPQPIYLRGADAKPQSGFELERR